MWSHSQFLSLPSSLLLLILSTSPETLSRGVSASAVAEPQWPYSLPQGIKYFPEDEVLVKRGLAAHQKISQDRRSPNGMRRMSPDPEAIFYLDYWTFEEEHYGPAAEQSYFSSNASNNVLPPLLAHMFSPNPQWHGGFAALRFSPLAKRDFTCPSGYSSCSSIGRQFSCCASGSSCVIVSDTGLGDVGCCPPGASCGNSMGSCDQNAGYKSCPNTGNGGCCMPGFDCFDVGCISTSTSTTTTTLAAATHTSCSSGFNTCASSLGGGCCPTSLTCGSSNSCFGASTSTTVVTQSPTTTSAIAIVPVRPTDSDTNVASPTIITTGTQLLAICPTNFYFCSAYYRPGCCRIGRDCAMTNCPAATSSSTFVSNGVTIVVPVGGSTGGQTLQSTAIITGTGAASTYGPGGSCASGWLSCAQSVGGGCCPGGFTCGAECSGSGGASGSVVAKTPPSAAERRIVGFCGWMMVVFGSGFGVAMILL